jgi:DNA replicative helicase MCM subunit Mcm2 (Cdc46/Mcm family)
MYDHNETLLNIDCMNIYAFDAQLYQQLVMYPAEVLVLLDKEAKQVICEIARQDDLDFTVEVIISLAHRIPNPWSVTGNAPSNFLLCCVYWGSTKSRFSITRYI